MAQIAIMREGRSHRESKTFDREPAARAWIKKREAELAKPGALAQARTVKRDATLGEAIGRYQLESKKKGGRTKNQVMRALKADPIADLACSEVGSQDVVDLASRLADGRSPATVSNYLSHLSPVFAIARPGWGIPLDERAMADGIIVAKKLGLVGKSKQRDRRPTLNELDRLLSHFEIGRERRPETMPMAAILAFAVFSTRRQEEITLLRWDDLDIDGKRILVRDMKDPEIKEGNNVWCELPDEALRIAQAQPRTDPEIFPYNHRTVSANMTRATALLDIDNLHFHDLRHEGISRLFETGRTIPQAASVSGHRSWATLKRYAHLRQVGDKYAGWAWLDRLAPKPDGEDPAAGAIAPVAVGTPL